MCSLRSIFPRLELESGALWKKVLADDARAAKHGDHLRVDQVADADPGPARPTRQIVVHALGLLIDTPGAADQLLGDQKNELADLADPIIGRPAGDRWELLVGKP